MARRPRKADYDYYLGLKTRDVLGQAVNTLIRWGGVAAIFFFCWKMTQALAGQDTYAQLGLSLFAQAKTSRGVAMALFALFGVGGSVYGYKQRELRQDDVESRARYIAELESRIDPKRTSSQLTKRGNTRKEDRI